MYVSKSKRVNAVDSSIAWCEREGRYAKAFRVDLELYQEEIGGFELTPVYCIQYGNDGMPYDHRSIYGLDDLEGVEIAMKNFNNLRGWRSSGE